MEKIVKQIAPGFIFIQMSTTLWNSSCHLYWYPNKYWGNFQPLKKQLGLAPSLIY